MTYAAGLDGGAGGRRCSLVRLLHVSDWHIGRILYKEPRAQDHDAVLAQIRGIAADVRPHLILHTGDLFETARPAVEDMQRALSALQELAATAPVLVLAGNHDSPALFRLFNSLLNGAVQAGVKPAPPAHRDGQAAPAPHGTGQAAAPAPHGAGTGWPPRILFVDRAHSGPAGVVSYPVDTEYGEQRLKVAPLPFVREGLIVDTMEDPVTWLRSYAERVHAMEQALGAELHRDFDPARDVTVFATHLHVRGATFHGTERPIHVNDVYATFPQSIPQVSYAAFGHIHQPQPLPGGVPGRYAGSPIPLDFGELDEEKTVVLVDMEPGQPARIEPVPLSAGRRLRQFTGTLEQLAASAPGWGNALSKLVIHTEAPMPDLSDRLSRLLPQAVLCSVTEICAGSTLAPIEAAQGDAAPEPQLPDLFREYLATTVTAGVEAERVAANFSELLRSAGEEHAPQRPEDRLVEKLLDLAQRADRIAAGETGDPAETATAAAGDHPASGVTSKDSG
jgi:DNA repair protein SbcD/Mre11